MPISREVEVSGYAEVSIDNEEIIFRLNKKDAIEVIDGLLKKFPGLADILIKHSQADAIIYPKLREALINKHKKENNSLLNF